LAVDQHTIVSPFDVIVRATRCPASSTAAPPPPPLPRLMGLLRRFVFWRAVWTLCWTLGLLLQTIVPHRARQAHSRRRHHRQHHGPRRRGLHRHGSLPVTHPMHKPPHVALAEIASEMQVRDLSLSPSSPHVDARDRGLHSTSHHHAPRVRQMIVDDVRAIKHRNR